MKKPIAAVLSIAIALSGCATASKNISSNYVSPLQYQSYDCEQLASESQRLQAKTNQLGGRLDEASSNDKSLGVVTAIFFWPAIFALGGTKQQEAEYAQIKGENDALQQTAVIKKCPAMLTPVQAVSAPTTSNVATAVKP